MPDPLPVHSAPPLLPPLNSCTVAVIGLGYVGLPLAVAFATPAACVLTAAPLKRRVIGFDTEEVCADPGESLGPALPYRFCLRLQP